MIWSRTTSSRSRRGASTSSRTEAAARTRESGQAAAKGIGSCSDRCSCDICHFGRGWDSVAEVLSAPALPLQQGPGDSVQLSCAYMTTSCTCINNFAAAGCSDVSVSKSFATSFLAAGNCCVTLVFSCYLDTHALSACPLECHCAESSTPGMQLGDSTCEMLCKAMH